MRRAVFAVVFWCQVVWLHTLAQTSTPQSVLAQMPVKELVVFKDGHAYVIHEGEMPTDARGNVVLDYLPAPILGTFWAYSATPQAKLQAVVAGQRRVDLKHTALNLRELLEANVGARVVLTEVSGTKHTGVIAGVLVSSSEEQEAISPPNTGDKLPAKSNILLLKTEEGTRAMNIDRVLDVTFLGDYATTTTRAEFRNLLTLHLNWANRQPARSTRVGMMYVQKGVRWIPQYRLVLDGKGGAKMFLQASLINELTDFRDATVDLVVGVPSFAYKDTRDPIGLQQTFAQLSPYFRTDAGQVLSNAIMAQASRELGGGAAPSPPPSDLGPEVAGAGASEDLFVFTVKGVSLRKGERMTLPVSEYTLKYRDVYTLLIPPVGSAPPDAPQPEPRIAELQSALAAPKVIHRVRLTNNTDHPFTTAPILLFSGNTVLAQDTITYTPRGGALDIAIGTAVNIPVKQSDKELKRTAKATTISGVDYTLVEMEGTLTLTNHSERAVELEVTRQVLGEVENTTPEAEVSKPTVAGRLITFADGMGYPAGSLNPLSQIVWKFSLAPGKSIDLKCRWRYYTR
ncbi:MAG: hypothetical protein RMM08_05240 [Armatimonadota bacterium]|nr:DUF4139 domain-containing protein [bacterium]MDW8320745.1 hypothetical protein [Armatimonadota bacterium]